MARFEAMPGWSIAVVDAWGSDAQLSTTESRAPWVTIMIDRDGLLALRRAIGDAIMAMDQRDYGKPREDTDD